ncbi:hypothetical protein BpHYR1_047278 [Brachionus plicatilis]|uniref:Uncharacterized protein n=1 Tax=Brachionus plicatilis TaxID=10195 RepID=A0A3M7PD43_BRAPC|nr:hypothetical protein BpHYR1_047278 [Brachionus plicatilis]
MENSESIENIKYFVKETLTACTHFGITCDEYLLKFEDIYKDTYADSALKLESILIEKFPQLTNKDRNQLFEIFFESFADAVKTEADCLQEYLTLSIFRIPREVILPEDAELQNSIDNYSQEEDLELSKKIETAQKSLIEKRVYIKNLKERIARFDLCSSVFD